jgi:hypothetical protein
VSATKEEEELKLRAVLQRQIALASLALKFKEGLSAQFGNQLAPAMLDSICDLAKVTYHVDSLLSLSPAHIKVNNDVGEGR